MSIRLTVTGLIDGLNERIGKIAAWAIAAAIVVSATNAIARRFLGMSSNAWLELQWYLFGAVFMLCTAWTLKSNEHIRIDIISSRFSKRTRDYVELFGHVVFLLPFVAVMIYTATPYFWKSFLSDEVSASAGGLLLWPAKGLILLGFISLGLQWLSELIKRIAIIRGQLPDEHASVVAETETEPDIIRVLAGERITLITPISGETPD